MTALDIPAKPRRTRTQAPKPYRFKPMSPRADLRKWLRMNWLPGYFGDPSRQIDVDTFILTDAIQLRRHEEGLNAVRTYGRYDGWTTHEDGVTARKRWDDLDVREQYELASLVGVEVYASARRLLMRAIYHAEKCGLFGYKPGIHWRLSYPNGIDKAAVEEPGGMERASAAVQEVLRQYEEASKATKDFPLARNTRNYQQALSWLAAAFEALRVYEVTDVCVESPALVRYHSGQAFVRVRGLAAIQQFGMCMQNAQREWEQAHTRPDEKGLVSPEWTAADRSHFVAYSAMLAACEKIVRASFSSGDVRFNDVFPKDTHLAPEPHAVFGESVTGLKIPQLLRWG